MSTLADRSGTVAAGVRAAGCAVWRRTGDESIEAALVHRPRYDDWSLPKGKPESGEHLLQTAVREVSEETGLEVVVGRRSVRTCYEVPGSGGAPLPKVVDYWTAECVGGRFASNDEVDDLRWLTLADAALLCTHDHDRAVLADLARIDVPRSPSLLLVRHGHAGSNGTWDGPDDLRPLDPRGEAEARRLADVLPLFGPRTVFSAPPLRCRQTVNPLAERLGLAVQLLPELGEDGFGADPRAGLAVVERLLAPSAGPGVTVVCSQGGAIPSVLVALGVQPGATRDFPPAAKGSVWVLGGRPGALSADYYRDFAS